MGLRKEVGMTAFALRPYQQAAIDSFFSALRNGRRRGLIVAPTGAGKTVIASAIVAKGVAAGRRVLLLAHTEELVDQLADMVREMTSIDSVGIVRAEHDQTGAQVIVGSVQTLCRTNRLAAVGAFNLIVIDEAHHAAAQSYRDILTQLGAFTDEPHAPRVLGITATPDRGDGQGLDAVFEEIVYDISILHLIKQNHLADIKAKRICSM